MAITAAGVGSGLDIETIVSQLMTLERRPLVELQRKEAQTQSQISALGTLKSALSSFKDAVSGLNTADKFRIFSTTSSDAGVLSATTDSSAASGSYSLDVQRLAQHHKQGSGAIAAGATFGGTAGDSLTLSVNGNASTIDLSSAQDLGTIRDAINDAGDNPGVVATIVNAGGGDQHLVLTSESSGYDQRVQLSYGGSLDSGTFGFGTLNQDAEGATLADLTHLDAAFSVDGIAITAADNQVSGVVDGLTLDLKGVGSSTLNVERDTEGIRQSAQEFVDGYNAVVQQIDKLKGGALGNESLLRGIVSQFRSVLNTPLSGGGGSFSSLSEIGVKTNGETGELELDAAEFDDALSTDFSAVSNIFTDPTSGYATRFVDVADRLLEADGLLESRVDTLDSRVRDYQDRQNSLESNLVLKEKSLRARYASLDALVASLNSTSQFLASRLNQSQG